VSCWQLTVLSGTAHPASSRCTPYKAPFGNALRVDGKWFFIRELYPRNHIVHELWWPSASAMPSVLINVLLLPMGVLTRAWRRTRNKLRAAQLQACVPDMAQNSRGASPRARCQRRRRRGAGQGRHRAVGSGGSPIHRCGATHRNRIRGVGPPGTSGHVTVKSSLRGGVGLRHPASTPRKFGVFRREVCRVSRSKVGRKSRGTAGTPGGNRANNPPPAAMTRTERGEIPADRHADVSRGHRRHAGAC
jgi:hypothetical protein